MNSQRNNPASSDPSISHDLLVFSSVGLSFKSDREPRHVPFAQKLSHHTLNVYARFDLVRGLFPSTIPIFIPYEVFSINIAALIWSLARSSLYAAALNTWMDTDMHKEPNTRIHFLVQHRNKVANVVVRNLDRRGIGAKDDSWTAWQCRFYGGW